MVIKLLKILGIVVAVLVFLLMALIAYLSITEYNPEPRESIDYYSLGNHLQKVDPNKPLTFITWNIGYAGLGEESDFFMDGGKMVNPPNQQVVEKNLAGILEFMDSQSADGWFLQEVDVNSTRTNYMNQFDAIRQNKNVSSAFAYNYKCPFVPIPLPPLGRIEGGIATVSSLQMSANMERVSLPCPFAWPVRVAQIKRCLLITRLPIANSGKELVLVNLHLEAYDDGEGKIAQTNLLLEVLQEEYAKGNYVIAGGDFNQSFPGVLNMYPVEDPQKWTPGILEQTILPEGWQFAYDVSAPTCRLLDQPYSDACQLYVIDGFILSPNVSVVSVKTVDLDFTCSDHNPVRLEVTLTP